MNSVYDKDLKEVKMTKEDYIKRHLIDISYFSFEIRLTTLMNIDSIKEKLKAEENNTDNTLTVKVGSNIVELQVLPSYFTTKLVTMNDLKILSLNAVQIN